MMAKNQELWEKFKSSGKVEDYLKYKEENEEDE